MAVYLFVKTPEKSRAGRIGQTGCLMDQTFYGHPTGRGAGTHRRFYIGMTHQFFEGYDVHTIFQQMAGIGVAQCVCILP